MIDLAPLVRGVSAHASAVSLAVVRRGQPAAVAHTGMLRDAPNEPAVSADTLYDLASLTKVVTALAVVRLVERRELSLDDTLTTHVPEAPAGRATLGHALTHTTGLPATAALYRDPDPWLALSHVVTLGPPGEVRYSDLGFIVLGAVLARRTESPLDVAMDDAVVARLGVGLRFGPVGRAAASTGWCEWRGREIQGEPHDENAAAIGGIAGHAGLFGTLSDVAGLAGALLGGGGGVVTPATLVTMTREHAAAGAMRRGLGFSLWSPDPDAASHPFNRSAFGHSGFTGTSLWVDPGRGLAVVLLTNAVARARYTAAFQAARVGLHRSIVSLADAGAL